MIWRFYWTEAKQTNWRTLGLPFKWCVCISRFIYHVTWFTVEMTKAHIWGILRDNKSVEQAVLHCTDKGTLIESSLIFAIYIVHLLLFPWAIFVSPHSPTMLSHWKAGSLFNIRNPAFTNRTDPVLFFNGHLGAAGQVVILN